LDCFCRVYVDQSITGSSWLLIWLIIHPVLQVCLRQKLAIRKMDFADTTFQFLSSYPHLDHFICFFMLFMFGDS
jgi:hypothetical protein